MGACDFMNVGCGKSAQEVFSQLRDDAAYEHGHGGYTGTIAEKSSFTMLPTPNTRLDIRDLTECAISNEDTYTVWRKLKEGEADPGWGSRTKYSNDGTTTTFVPEKKKIPDSLKPWVERAARAADDKWGPAACVEITGKQAKEIKERSGFKGKRGIKVFAFFGLASS